MPGIVRLAAEAEQARAGTPGLLARPRRRPLARPNYRQYDGGMTESEWQSCIDPTPMLEFLRHKASKRKCRLFTCACCQRWVWKRRLNQFTVVSPNETLETSAQAPTPRGDGLRAAAQICHELLRPSTDYEHDWNAALEAAIRSDRHGGNEERGASGGLSGNEMASVSDSMSGND